MGLDMYLTGDKYLSTKFGDDPRYPDNIYEDGFRVKSRRLELGCWRKHPNLHGYIVNEFAGGKDECQVIPLSHQDILKIITAITSNQLPETEGFFFGSSDGSEFANDLAIFTKTLEWLEAEEFGVWRSVEYQASW